MSIKVKDVLAPNQNQKADAHADGLLSVRAHSNVFLCRPSKTITSKLGQTTCLKQAVKNLLLIQENRHKEMVI